MKFTPRQQLRAANITTVESHVTNERDVWARYDSVCLQICQQIDATVTKLSYILIVYSGIYQMPTK